jgi:hypothetical protein
MLIAFKQAQLNKISPHFDQRQFKPNGFILQINFLLQHLLHGGGGNSLLPYQDLPILDRGM